MKSRRYADNISKLFRIFNQYGVWKYLLYSAHFLLSGLDPGLQAF